MASMAAPPASTASSETTSAGPRWFALGRSILWDARVILFVGPCLALYMLFVVWPLLDVCWLSLQRWDGYGPQHFIGATNFVDLGADSLFRTALGHSLIWAASAALLTACAFALALAALRSRARAALLPLIFFPVLLPPTAVAALWTLVYTPVSGMLNTVLRAVGLGGLATGWLGDPHLALPALMVSWGWSCLGIGVLILFVGLRSIGQEYIDLALVEGAGPLWRLRYIMLPGVGRLLVLVAVLNAALALQVFDLVFATTGGGPGYATMLLSVDMYGRAFGGHTGQGAAVAVVQLVSGLALAVCCLVLVRRPTESMHTGELRDGARGPAATITLALSTLVILSPLLWILLVTIGGGQSSPGSPVSVDPRTWAWDNFSIVWNAGMGGAMATSAFLAAIVTGMTLLLAAPAAFGLARMIRMPSRRTFILTVLGVGLFQPVPVLIIPLFSLLQSLNLIDNPWGVILPDVARALPFAVLVLWGFLMQLPEDVLRAAEVDGASPLQQMLRVALPLAAPALWAVAIWSWLVSWNDYLLPTLVSQDGTMQTVPTLLASFIGKYDTQYGLLAAGTVMAVAPCLLIYFALRRPAGRALQQVERGVE